MEAKKVRKGVWNSFRPCPTSAGHADNKAPTALSRLVFFSSPPPTLPIPQSLWGSSGNLRMEVRSPGYRIRSFTREREREWEGIGNDVSPKVTDQPEFSRFLWISCVSIVKKKKKNSVSRRGTIDPSNQDFPRSGISSSCGTNRSDNHCSKINRR